MEKCPRIYAIDVSESSGLPNTFDGRHIHLGLPSRKANSQDPLFDYALCPSEETRALLNVFYEIDVIAVGMRQSEPVTRQGIRKLVVRDYVVMLVDNTRVALQ